MILLKIGYGSVTKEINIYILHSCSYIIPFCHCVYSIVFRVINYPA